MKKSDLFIFKNTAFITFSVCIHSYMPSSLYHSTPLCVYVFPDIYALL